MTSTNAEVDLDSILKQLGSFGWYHIQNYCFILLPIMFSAMYNGQYIFAAASLQYRCIVPECEATPPEMLPGPWAEWSLPADGWGCQRLRPVDSTCTPSSFTNETMPCDGWLYENSDSIVHTFDLACEEWKRTLVGTIHSFGLFTGLPFTAYVSDTFGRRTALVLTATAAGVTGLLKSFSPNYITYLVFEFLEPMVGSGVFNSGFILALEMVGQNRRVLGGNIISCTYAVGQVVLALVAWSVPDWRTLTRILYTPSLLFIFYFFVIEESVRWLLSKGNKKEAARIIFKAANMNLIKLSPEAVKQLTEDPQQKQVQPTHQPIHIIPESQEKKPSMAIQILKSKIIMTRLCICSFWWITVTFIYYGLSINSVSMAGNRYLNYILTSLVEIPGYYLSVLTLDTFGRRGCIMTTFFICGISLFSLPFIPSSFQWLQTSLTMLGKLCISMCFSSIYIYTSELFPTEARHRLLGICSMVGRIGSIVAPQTPLLMMYIKSLPYLLFGGMAVTAGLLMLLTPETVRKRLPDTVAQAEDIASPRNNKKPADVIVGQQL